MNDNWKMKSKGRKASLNVASHTAEHGAYYEPKAGHGNTTKRLRQAKRKARAKGKRSRQALEICGITVSVPAVENPRPKIYQAEIGFNGYTFTCFRESLGDERKSIQSTFLNWLKRQLESERLRDGKALSRFPVVKISFEWKYVNRAWKLVGCADKTRTLKIWELKVS